MTNTNAKRQEASVTGSQSSEAIIFAPATAPGASGVAVMRISGDDLSEVCEALSLASMPAPRRATLCELVNRHSGEPIDQALVLYFPAPHSFTGEEVLELHTHGGKAVRDALVQCLSGLPRCRMAEPGEFSKRAFFNGKMDLLQAEGVADLIAAETTAQHQLALTQLGGHMSKRYEALREKTVRALALLEAYIDFPDEEIPDETLAQVSALTRQVSDDIRALLGEEQAGEMIRDGFCIAIIGPPNAGKSSLLNALAKRDVAIVSDIAGTTRDQIEIHLNLGGYLVRLIDTAGIRDAADQIESEGIRRAKAAAASAHLKLAVFDIISLPELNNETLSLLADDDLIILNKSDQIHEPIPNTIHGHKALSLSAQTGYGIPEMIGLLREIIEQRLTETTAPALTRLRHREALKEADEIVSRFDPALPLELSCETLRQTAFSVGKITGKIDVDQLLDVIFREFCIGK